MPSMARPIPHSGADLRLMLSYEPDTGVLRWNERPLEHFASKAHGKSWNRRLAGAVAGTLRNSAGKVYVQIAVAGRFFPAHRIAWLMIHNSFDESLEIDHINGDGTDNRLVNLRLVSHHENQKNLSRRVDNASGVTGVAWDALRGKWLVRGYVAGRQKNLGRFDDFDAAVAARRSYEQQHGYHTQHGMSRQDKAAAA